MKKTAPTGQTGDAFNAAYDQTANSPGAWWFTGESLFLASTILRDRVQVESSTDPASDPRSFLESVRLRGPMLMLRACACECFLKTLLLDKGHRLGEGGRYRGPKGKGHDLSGLADLASFPLSNDERAILDRLSRWNTLGRYPVQTSASLQFYMPQGPGDSGSNWDVADEEVFLAFRARLRTEADRLEAPSRTSPSTQRS